MFSFLLFSFLLFFIGFLGTFLSRSNLIIILLAFELMLLASVINFAFFSIVFDDLLGQLFGLFSLCLSASESALGLAILVVFYRLRGGVSVDLISFLKS